VGRPHIARVLVQSRCVRTLKQAFTRYLAKGAEAYVSREKLSAAEAVAVIQGAGGVVALAHPTQLICRTFAELNQVVAGLVDLGVEAIEVHHPDHRPEDARVCMDLAKRYDLLMVGGSDFHGPLDQSHRCVGFSSNRIPYEWLTELQKCVAGRRADRTG
jgi:predicted metal-dependent phosphoesterase TrpH